MDREPMGMAMDGDFEGADSEWDAAVALVLRMDEFTRPLRVVADLEAVLYWELGIVVELKLLLAMRPGNGFGTRYMERLCEEADGSGVALRLRPGGARSRAFYARFGFEARPGRDMRRVPVSPAPRMA
jgi:hypothetical protein